MKKITVIIASPEKNGNSETLLDSFLKEAEELKIKIKIYDLKQLDIAYHCHACKTPLKQEGEFIQLVSDIQSSQLLIVATPTYNFSVPARLKNLVDRLGFMDLDYQNLNCFKQPTGKLGHLKTYFIVTGGTPNCIIPAFSRSLVTGYFLVLRSQTRREFLCGKFNFLQPS